MQYQKACMGFVLWLCGLWPLGGWGDWTSIVWAEAPLLTADVGIEEHLGQRVTLDLLFSDEQGQSVRLGDFFQPGKPVLLTLVYYRCPHLCQYLLNGLVSSLKPFEWTMGERYQGITVSIEPKETFQLASQKKAAYIQLYGRQEAASGWHFLTGSASSIQQLAKEVGFRYRWDEAQQQYAHAAATFVLTPDGQISRVLYGIEHSVQNLKLALLEASQGKIGTVMDRLLLFCFQYDPVTRRYSLVLMRVVQLGAVVTVLGIGGYLLWAVRLRQRKGKSIP